MNKHLLILLVGRSCSGKTTTVRELQKQLRWLHEAVSTTSRPIRAGEIDRLDYNFVTRTDFEKMIKENNLIEYVDYNGNYYGLSKSAFDPGTTNIAIVEPDGVNIILDKMIGSFNITVVKMDEDDSIILDRFEKRGDPIGIRNKRFPADKKRFLEIPYDYLISASPVLLKAIIRNYYKDETAKKRSSQE